MQTVLPSVCAAVIVALALASDGGAAARRQGSGVHLAIRDTQFVGPDGQPFHWRGITAFRLLEMIARGRTPEVEAYLDWCAAQRLNVVRVLTMARHIFRLNPEEGRSALPRLLELAWQRRLHVEIVALADTAEFTLDIDRHVREIGAIAASNANAIVEIANEPAHHTQNPRLHSDDELVRLSRLVPEPVPVALGSAEVDGRFSTGDFATVHFPRHTGEGGWAHVAALASGADLMVRWRKPVVNDEPIGAGEAPDPGRRDDSPERFRAAALLSRMIGMGATFHYERGLDARIPEGRERECFDAWNEASSLLPAGGAFTFTRPGDGAPARLVTGDFVGAYIAVRGEDAWLLVIGTRGDVEITWADGWRPGPKRAWGESMWWPATRVR